MPLSTALLAEIDRIADEERRTRANVVRILLEDGLEAYKGRKRER